MSRLFSPDHKIIRLSYAITASVFMLIGFSQSIADVNPEDWGGAPGTL